MPAITSSGARQELAGGRSSAPVLEFLCLFTHDLHRKQKRWQDGRLKYHAFNKRVMVYDDRGNSVGDMHWQRDWEFDEGEEIKLDRGGVIVQVQECVGRQNQDLTDLLDKRAKEKEERQSRTAARRAPVAFGLRTPAVPSRVYPAQTVGSGSHHRRLDQVLTPTGHHGRAVVPTESPFEQRQRDQEAPDGNNEAPGSKRRKYDDNPPSKLGYAQSLFGAPLTLSAVPMSSAPTRRPAASATRMHSEPASSQEERPQADETRERESHSSKRRKRGDMPPSKMGYSQSLFGASLNLSAVPLSSTSIPRRTTPAARVHTEPPSSQEDGPQQKDTVGDVQDIPVNLSVRAGLSRATATAPLLKTRLPPLERAPKLPAHNKAAGIGAREREVDFETQTETMSPVFDPEEDDPSAIRSRNSTKLSGKEQHGGQKAALKPNKSLPVVIIGDEAGDDVDPNNGTDADFPPRHHQKPVPKAVSPKAVPTAAVPTTKQPKTSKSTKSTKSAKSNRTTKAQNDGSKNPVQEDGETTGLYMPPEGPRAQLRIQPRQKRGLLVSSEKGSRPKKSKVRQVEVDPEAEYDTEPAVPSPVPAASLGEGDPFASFVDPVREPGTVNKPRTPPRQQQALHPKGEDEIPVAFQAFNGNQPSNAPANNVQPLDLENDYTHKAPVNKMVGARSQGTSGAQSIAWASKRPAGQQMTAGLVGGITQDQGSTAKPSDLPRVPTSPRTRPDGSTEHLPDNVVDEEDITERPRTRQTRKRVTLALAESDDENLPTRQTKKRRTMVSDGSDDEELETRQSTSRNRSVVCEDDDEERPTRQSKRRAAVAFDTSDDEGLFTRLTRRRRPTEVVAEESGSDELPQVPVGPRLARLRKSVKSREVIGFVPSSSPVMERVTMAESQPPPTPAPLPPHLPTPSFLETVPSLDISDTNSLANVNELKVIVSGTKVPEQEFVALPVTHNLPTSKASPPLPQLKSATDKVSAGRRDISHPTTTSRGAPVNKSAPDPTPVHLEQSISDSPSGEPPHHHVTSASGAEKAGKSAITHQQTMKSVDTTSASLSMLSGKGPNLITREVEGDSRSNEAVSHPEVHKHPFAVPRDAGISSVASNNPNGQAFKVPPAANNPRPKITNPATRGRKAALKSHAAGQVPQSIVPVEPAPVRLTVMRPPETTRPEAAAGGRPKYKMQLPGFTSAKETARDTAVDIGPWSREAHDLFGNGRPSS